MAKRKDPKTDAPPQPTPIRWWEWLPLLGTGALLSVCMHANRGYIKDDAFISYRYALNLARGNGMVYNLDERVEGYTNFLWIVFTAPAFWVGADPVVWSKVMGAGCGLGTMVLIFLMTRWLRDGQPSPAHYVAPLIFASSASIALWTMSGMAPVLIMLCGTAAIYYLWRALEEDRKLDWILAGVAMTGAALTRPEGHMFFIAGAIAVGVVVIRRQAVPKNAWWMIGIFLAVITPYHLWRLLYFGDLLPNTYCVKAAGGPEVWKEGWGFLGGMLGFNLNAVIGVAALLALIPSRKRWYRLGMVLLCVFFMLYMVKVGRDEMKYYRLFLPVYGLFVVVGAEGMRALPELWKGWKPAWVATIPAFVIAIAPVINGLQVTDDSHSWHNRYVQMSEDSFQEMGRYILERSEPDDVAIFQDAGACAFAAHPIEFVDPIGVLNPFIAHELAAIEMNPFLKGVKRAQPGGVAEIRELDRKVCEHLYEQDARWVGMVAYVGKKPKGNRSKFRKKYQAALDSGDDEQLEAVFRPALTRNSHHHGMYSDRRFAQRYELEKTWKRNSGYYLVLFQRKD